MRSTKETFEHRMAVFRKTCRERGLRITPQRLAVFRELASSREHPSAEAIYKRVHKRLAATALDTVYRTLATLEEMGLVARVGVAGNSQRFECGIEPHHHFICRVCGAVLDVFSEKLDQVRLFAPPPDGCTIESAQVAFRGLCRDCAKPPKRRRTARR